MKISKGEIKEKGKKKNSKLEIRKVRSQDLHYLHKFSDHKELPGLDGGKYASCQL